MNKKMKTAAATLAAVALMSASVVSASADQSSNTNSSMTSISSTMIFSASKPAKVKSISAKSDSVSVKLSWKKVSGATGYRVYKYIDGKWTKIKTTKSLSYTDSDLNSSTAYKYKVKAYTKNNGKTIWGDASSTFKYCTTPTKVTYKSSVKDYDAITLNWNKVDCTGYQIYMKQGSQWVKLDTLKNETKATTYTVTGLSEGKKYNFKVRAFYRNGANYFAAMSAKNYTTLADVTAPSAPTLTSSATKDAIRINWTDVDADGYQIYIDGKLKTTVKNALTYRASGLTAGTTYKFKVRAYRLNRFGQKIYSDYAEKSISTKEADFLDTLTPTEKAYYDLALGHPTKEGIELIKKDCIDYTFEKFGPLMEGKSVSWNDGLYDYSINPPAPIDMVVNPELYANDAIDTNAGFFDGTANITMLQESMSNSEKKKEIESLRISCHEVADQWFGEYETKLNSGKKNYVEFNIAVFSLGYEEFGIPKYQITFLY